MFAKRSAPDSGGRKSADRAKAREEGKKSNRAQLNLFGLPDDNDEEDDSNLEAELNALLGGQVSGATRSPRKAVPQIPVDLGPIEIPDFEKSDGDDDDDNLDDPDLEAELSALTNTDAPRYCAPASNPVVVSANTECTPDLSKGMLQFLEERLVMYEKALGITESGSAKGRRLVRAIKTLKDLIRKAKAGSVIDEAEIPPAISTTPAVAVSTNEPISIPTPTVAEPRNEPVSTSATVEPVPVSIMPVLLPDVPAYEPLSDKPTEVVEERVPEKVLMKIPSDVAIRIKEYKKYAVALKRAGDTPNSLKYLKLAKTLESAATTGLEVDLSSYPCISTESQQPVQNEFKQGASEMTTQDSVPTVAPPVEIAAEEPSKPVSEKTMLESLEERLEKYKSEVTKASEADNPSKARRFGRIVKQYEDAIKLHKRGKPVPYDELPTPPGFDPLPIPGGERAIPGTNAPSGIAATGPVDSEAINPTTPAAAPTVPGTASGASRQSSGNQRPQSVSPASGSGKKPSNSTVLQQKQLNLLLKRQQQFKSAAINAKKRGDVEHAREYLRTAKGIDKLIEANKCGFPVDMNTVPSEPEAVGALEAENFELVSAEDCIEPTSDPEVYAKLEEDFKKQIKMCVETRNHYKAIGDVASANRFEKLALESKQDLDVLRIAAKQGGNLPKFHYVHKVFSITECNTDLTEDEIEIAVLQGVNYKVSNPTTVDTYVKVELCYPSAEEMQTNKTALVKDTNNPAYNTTFKMSINRGSRFQRFVHRHGVKFEVWAKGGFFKGNTLIGTATAKLAGLETKCTVHDAFEVLEGRKPVGKLEVKMRLRDPVLSKQITQKNQRWLALSRA